MKNRFSRWLFDLDNTLYPVASGLFAAIDDRINRYLELFCDVPLREADSLRTHYFRTYGLTLIGLMRERSVDPEHYLEYVHRVPVERYLKPDRRLLETLRSIPAPKAVYTNGSQSHSRAVLGALGITEAFDSIFDIAAAEYVPKPDPRSYRMVLDRLGAEPWSTVLVEDLPANVLPAREMGMTTILGGGRGDSRAADHVLSSLDELPALLEGPGA